MSTEYTFTDKDRDYRTYQTISDDDGNNYSKIFFHKAKWNVYDRPDITELQDSWAEEIMQNIIDGYFHGGFEIIIHLENDEEQYHWLNWEIMSVWNGES